ncbi:SWIM zinc finger family protein [Quadrisphaera oryzae]|uniref:SWIM zinc finger family protein n=1 Tax=Quadrisphaera TaxID=317661 RepID=UPI00164558DE|nr:SWIM zinc finger family protein [Quadrisphaera sp. RL12-1S]
MAGRSGTTAWDSSWPPGTRIKADGIKPRSKRGAFATTWWGRRFTDAVEEAAGPGRLARGRTYARAGQVVHLDVATPGTRAAGRVLATVQGSRTTPYDVVLTLGTWDAETRGELADALAADPAVLTAVLGGTLPEAFEQLCLDAGLVLLPRSLSDLRTSCTCPDLVEPCKHAAAVVYLLAERLDTDPFTVLRLRGVDRDGLLSLVAERRAAQDDDESAARPARRAAVGGPLPADGSFWRGHPLPPPPDPSLPPGTSALDALDASLLGPAGDAVVARLRPLLAEITSLTGRVD